MLRIGHLLYKVSVVVENRTYAFMRPYLEALA